MALIPHLTDMATDPRKMKPGEVCRVLNSTPLGEVLDDRRLRQHRSRAGLRIGDGSNIDLFRYAAWLVDELKPAAAAAPIGSSQDLDLRWQHYQSIPKKDWVQMSGRQNKVIDEQGKRYGLPIDGPTINLPDFVRAFHDFLSVHARRLARQIGAVTEDGESDEPTIGDLMAEEKLLRERIRRKAEEKSYYPRDVVHAIFGEAATILRQAGELLQRKYGVEAHEILDQAIDEAVDRVNQLQPAEGDDALD